MAARAWSRRIAAPWLSLFLLMVLLAGLSSLYPANRTPTGRVFTTRGPAAGALISPPFRSDIAVTTGRDGTYFSQPSTQPHWIVALQGHFLAPTRGGPVYLQPVPEDHPETPWINPTPGTSPQACGSCHPATLEQWLGSPHQRSAAGPLFSALLTPETRKISKPSAWRLAENYPEASAACAACHAPGVSSLEAELPSAGILSGTHCDLCHKVKDIGPGTLGLTHGRDLFTLARPAPGGRPVVLGSLPDSPRENVAYSPLYKQSLFCAPCHEGTVLGAQVYTSFSEWLTWGGSQSCQDCHMPADGARRHHHGMTAELARLQGGLRTDWSVQRTPAATRVRLSIWSEKVGHALPTGHVDRHIVGWLEARDKDGKPLAPLGQTGLLETWATGMEQLVPGFLLARWQEKEAPGPTPFWSPGGTWRDTRLLPGQRRELEWLFPPEARGIHLRVEHRKAWPAMVQSLNLPLQGQVLVDEAKPISVRNP